MKGRNRFPHQCSLSLRSLYYALLLVLWLPLVGQAQRPSACDLASEESKSKFLNDQKPGSILVFNKYTSNPIRQLEDTYISITNVHAMYDIDLHMFFVDGSTGNIADLYLPLGPNQTRTFAASDVDPGVEGFMFAIATYGGIPTGFNYLVGEAALYEIDGFEATLPALAIGKMTSGDVNLNEDQTATMLFDGCMYERLPQVLAVPSFNSQVVFRTYVTLVSPPSSFLSNQVSATKIAATVTNDRVQVASTNLTMRRFRQLALAEIRFNADLNLLVPANGTGWLKFQATEEQPLLGALFNKGPRFKGGRNLAAVSLLKKFALTVPTDPPQ